MKKELAQHIRHLLLTNDCVIVPGLGGFITHTNSAQLTTEGNQMLPPSRSIAFNPMLKINDGLLAQSYMISYHTSFPDATRRINKAVKELVKSLYEDGHVSLPEIGELKFNIHQNYEFNPFDEKMVSPEFYGLPSCELESLADLKKQREAMELLETQRKLQEAERRRMEEAKRAAEEAARRAEEEARQREEEEKRRQAEEEERRIAAAVKPQPVLIPQETAAEEGARRTVRFTVGYAAAAAAAAILLMLFMFSTPLQNTHIGIDNHAELSPAELFKALKENSLIVNNIAMSAPSEVKAENAEAETAMQVVEENQEAEPVVTTEATASVQPDKIYHVIVASVGNASDAENMAQALTQKGYPDAKAIIGDGYNRISIASFETEQQAYAKVKQLKEDNIYQQSWVLRRK